jgi:hypothetical protein
LFQENLLNGFKLAFFCRVPEDRLPVSWCQVVAFGLVSLLIPLIYDLATVGLQGEVAWGNVPEALVHLPIFMLAAVAAAYLLGDGERSLLFWQTFLMIAVVVDSVSYLLYLIPYTAYAQRWSSYLGSDIYFVPLLWLALACGKAAMERVSASPPRRVLAPVACSILIIVPLTQIHRERSLWQAPPGADEFNEESSGQLGEDLVYEQPKILERELAAVQRGRRGVIDIYFIGVGGYGYQDVFMKEVDAVSRLFQERFTANGKTIRLINNRKNLTGAPVASVTGLRVSLQRVAEVMDKSEDILFLFLTSHGSKTHRVSFDLWPLRFHDLDPGKLRALLDESGIKNRVVVVSACYSGGFVDPLKDENTLVISASAPDKKSFGCSDRAEWTYFGKAYFDEALRKTYSFIEAFETAKATIAEREKTEGYTPSDPQIELGEAIKPRLVKLQRQLERDARQFSGK